ncbi:hypothetical protein H2203_003614 [Taxawa tesnikishii (nom. ined.)]|nr:hypothetical protein H2203_003614 [Dothideales sp. JES 119]
MANEEATVFLSSLLNKTLRVHVTDRRMFVGQMKCTDKDRNIILSLTHEFRPPSSSAVRAAASTHEHEGRTGNVKVDMLKRFVGLVVVPGQHITRIEVED